MSTRGVGSWVNTVLGTVGLSLQRVGRQPDASEPSTAGFYRPPASCQIRELATLYRLFLGERRDGLFVEVGAYDGITFSNSSCLADVGWHGILIEPVPDFAEACRQRYRGNDRVQVIQAAVGATNEPIEITVAGVLSTTDQGLLAKYRELEWAKGDVEHARTLTVTQRTLDDVLDAAAVNRQIDVLIVDVEGAEAAVFAGFTVLRWRPRMIIAELSHTHQDLHARSADAGLQRQIESWGYSVIYKDEINTIFLADAARSADDPARP